MVNRKDMIKALRCMASQNPVLDTCYRDSQPGVVCGEPAGDGKRCPYFQQPLDVCTVDGDMSWMEEAADAIAELEAVKDYIDKRMVDGGIPDLAFGVYNDVRTFIWGMERAKEANR